MEGGGVTPALIPVAVQGPNLGFSPGGSACEREIAGLASGLSALPLT